MDKHFTHLHLHTEFSLLDGAIRIEDLIRFSKEQQWKAVGISDHGNIFGAVKFFQLAKKEKIKPILGVEMYFTPDAAIKNPQDKYYHIILIVQNNQGYKNLCRLMAYAYEDGFYFKPRIDYAVLEKYSEGLIISTACLGGHIPKLLMRQDIEEADRRVSWFKDVFGPNRFFLELAPGVFEEQRKLNTLLFEHAARWNVSCIATSDAHYMSLDDHEAHEILLSVQTKDVLSNPDRYTFGECRCYVRTTQEMLDQFPNNPELIWNTGMIADSCEFEFEFGKLFFPQSPIPAGKTEQDYFVEVCQTGLQNIKDNDLIPHDQYEVYDRRLEEEVTLISKMGFIGYLLVVSDFIQWAKKQGIPVGPGRGSAAGSLVAWAMQITNVDPIKYNLLFERFLNPERVSMPDIDIDFCIEGRERVINYVKDKYGHDCVCQIITFGTMMAKGVIKDVSRVLGFPFQDANTLTELIPNALKISLQEALDQEPRLGEMIQSNPKVKQLFDICFKLEGITRHASKHAAGIIISPTPLAETLPLYIPSKTTDLVAQYAMTELESLGFLKMDFLGVKNLTVIDRALKAIYKNHGVKIDLDKIDLNDPKVYVLIGEGKTTAIFQFESDGLKEVLRKFKPDKFEDLIAINALYRPGPLSAGGMIEDYIERRHGRQQVTYAFPELEPVLAETYGVIVYQEQVMKIASAIAGYSLGAADILRRAMGKKKADVMAEQKVLFVEGAIKHGFNEKKSGEVFDLMAYFAGYGFNKSHAAAYALIAYHTAYLKTHYPNEFMAAAVTFETGDPEQMTHYLQEISDMHLQTIPPDINRSEIEFAALKEGGILFGLQGIKNVGDTALRGILEERDKESFKDLLNFCKRVDLRTVNKRVIENLICAGAMDAFPGNRAQKTAELEKVMALAHEYKEQQRTGQMDLFGMGKPIQKQGVEDYYAFAPLEDWPTKEKIGREKEVAGFYLSSHPLKSYPALKWLKVETFAQALEKIKTVNSLQEPSVVCVGLKQSFKQIVTKKGDKMAFLSIEDLHGNAEVIIFPKVYEKVSDDLQEFNVFLIKGFLDITSQDRCKIKANEIIAIERIFEQANAINKLQLTLPAGASDVQLKEIKQRLPQGSVGLQVLFSENGELLKIHCKQAVACTGEVLTALEATGAKIMLQV